MSRTWTWNFAGVLGSFDPLRNLIWVLYDTKKEIDPQFVTFNHEYNHLIGILGRHLQICLLHYYLMSKDNCAQIIHNERNIIESCVPVWLATPSRLGSEMTPFIVAPESKMSLVKAISQVCNDLHACTWIMNRKKPELSLEQIVRAVQQAILNVATRDQLYSAGASYTALECLRPLASQLAGKVFTIDKVSRGEYHTLVYGLAESKLYTKAERTPSTAEHGEMIELFLIDKIRRETALEPKRYTLHDRAQFIINWFCTFLSGNKSIEELVQVLAGIASVFMPGVFLPFAGFYSPSLGKFIGELHALPFARPAIMPIMRKTIGDKTADRVMIPAKILELRKWPTYILWQSNCPVGQAMSAFCKFAVSSIAWKTFSERAVAILSHLGNSLEAIISGLKESTCGPCNSMKQKLDLCSCTTLGSNIKELCYEAASDFQKWLCNHLAEDFKSSNINLCSPQNFTVSIDTQGSVIYEYTEIPEDFREIWDSGLES